MAEPVNDMKGWLLSVIIRDNSFFVLASKRSEWKGNACAYYTKLIIPGMQKKVHSYYTKKKFHSTANGQSTMVQCHSTLNR